ncbi:hypothetical protein Tco_1454200, partial [Tanacetum coccineum]
MAQLNYCDKHNQVGFLRKPNESAGFAEIVDFLRGSNLRYALTANPTIYDSLVKQFWQSAIASTKEDGFFEISATIDNIRECQIGTRTCCSSSAGQEHVVQAQSQPSPTPPPIPTSPPPPISSPTPPPIPTPTSPPPTPPPIPTPTSPPPPPPPPPETEPTTDEYIYAEHSPVHHHFSPSQEQAPSHMPMDDLLQAVPKLISRIDSLELDLKQTKLTMGNAIVKLVKKVKKLEGFMKKRNLVLTDSEEEEPEAQGRKSQDDPQDSSVQGMVTPPTTKVNTSGEEQVEEISPNTLEAAKTLSKVASLKPRSIDKGRRYKRRKETKGKKVVSSLDFQEEVDDVAEQVNTAGKVNTAGEEVNTEEASTVGEDKGQREGKAPMLSEETPK